MKSNSMPNIKNYNIYPYPSEFLYILDKPNRGSYVFVKSG